MTINPQQLYTLLLHHFQHQDWWPVDRTYHKKQGSDPRFEIMVGAILTQNTAWTNVEKALANIKEHQALTIPAILSLDEPTLKNLIQPSGFFNQKAQRLRLFATYLHEKYHDDVNEFFNRETTEIRNELLSMNGIGPETADSILLYAGNHPVFVIDAYTKRICQRFPIPISTDSYDDIQYYFQTQLQHTNQTQHLVPVYKELHALIVELAKNYCRKKKPDCTACPLAQLCKKAF